MTLLPAVMVRAPHQQEKVKCWLEYTKLLSPQYYIQIIDPPNPEVNTKNQDSAFRYALNKVPGPFLWLEPDSVPLTPNWLDQITTEYYSAGKPFMLPELNSIGDIGSGIGVYPKEAQWLIPNSFTVHAWDAWVYRNLRPAIHFTNLIQHSYGVYSGMYVTRRHAFPKDRSMLNDEAVLFHSDPMQTLARKLPVFYHTGDIGDIVAVLAIIKQMGGGYLAIGPGDPTIRQGCIPREFTMKGVLYDSIKSLIEMQDYIAAVAWVDQKPTNIDYDFSTFRLQKRQPTENLIQWQSRAVGLPPINENQWIKCGSHLTHDRIIVARSSRYHNPFFPWGLIANKYKERMLFIGRPDEHIAFEQHVGRSVELANTPTLLDMAKLIMGASIGFYNQSSPFWVAAGLAKSLVQESWIGGELNCVINRPNASYVTTDISRLAKLFNIPITI